VTVERDGDPTACGGTITPPVTGFTPYHARYYAHDLTRRAPDGMDRLSTFELVIEHVGDEYDVTLSTAGGSPAREAWRLG
jgi:hypothetical protein